MKIDLATGVIKKSISNWSNIETKNWRQKITKLTHPILASTNEVPEPSAAASEIGPEDEEAGSDQCFSKSEMTMRNQKKIREKGVGKGQVVQPNRTGFDKLEYVGPVGLGQGVFPIRWDRMGLGQRGLQISWDRMGLRQGVL